MTSSLVLALLLELAAARPSAEKKAPPGGRSLIVLMEASSVSAEFRASLLTTLQREVERSSEFRWVEPPAITVDELALALNCTGMDDGCLRRAGDNLKAESVMLVAVSGGGRKELVLSLVTVKPARPTRMAAVPLQESAATLQDMRQALRSLLGPVKPTRLAVVTDPPGAQVTVDGKSVGATPYAVGDLPEGKHIVAVALEGFSPQTAEVDLQGGQSQEVRLTMQKKVVAVATAPAPAPAPVAQATPGEATPAPAPTPGEPRPAAANTGDEAGGGVTRWLAVVPGVAGLGLGVAAMVGGVFLVVGGPVSYVGIWGLNRAAGVQTVAPGLGLTQSTALATFLALVSGGAVVAVAGLLVAGLSGGAAAVSAVLAATVL